MSNKITLVHGGRTLQARLRSYGDWPQDSYALLYWRGHRWNGHVSARDEGVTWIRGWDHNKKTRDALVCSAALSR